MENRDDELAHTATAPGASSGRAAADPVGATLGRYRLERMLGEGGMGVVHAAFDPDLERRVALKVLRAAAGSDEARQRLLREARAMARLTHANVVTVHEVGTAGDRDYVAMELIDGATLADWLKSKPPPTTDEITTAFVAAGRGLAAAHAAGLVHRDFKPHNVLRRRDGRIVVTDFGLARGVEPGREQISLDTTLPLHVGHTDSAPSSPSGLTQTGSVLGTPAYMAPEQWTGGTVGPAADQFAFCVALWEALCGERPYRGDTIEALKERIASGPGDLDASKLPRALRRPLRRGLDPVAAKRWPSMDALLAAITRRSTGPGFAIAGAGAALVALGIGFLVFHGDGVPTCTPPAIDPDRVWSATLNGTMSPELASVFATQIASWNQARATACTADPTTRAAQLHCLDGALARFDAIRQAYPTVAKIGSEDVLAALADPSACLTPAPPRLSMRASPDVIAALGLYARTEPRDADPPSKDAQTFADRSGLEPCARSIALHAVEESAPEVAARRAAINEAVATSDQCDDDRLRAEMLIAAAPYQFELPVIGPKGQAGIRRADAAAIRTGEPALIARVEFLRSFVATQEDHWKQAFELADHAIKVLDDAGLHRRAVAITVEALEMRITHAEPADFDVIRTTAAKWAPIAERLGEHALAEDLERDVALVRWTTGDIAGAHAELVRLWHPPPHMKDSMKVDGEVVDREGKPVGGATVAAARTLGADSVGVPFPAFRLHYGDRDLRAVTTDAAGHFELPEAPDRGAIIAQLADRRSIPVAVSAHVKLVLEPTHRVSGTLALGSRQYTETAIVIEAVDDHTDSYRLLGPVAADGTFAIDGAPIRKLRIAVAIDNRLYGTQLAYKDLPASPEPITNIQLAVEASGRPLDVVARSTLTTPLDTAQIVILAGRVQVANVGALMARSNSGLATQFAHHIVGESVPPDAIDKIKPGDLTAHFADVPAGEITVCVIGLSGDMMDSAMMRKIQAHMAELELKCETIEGDAKVVVIAAPPQKRFD